MALYQCSNSSQVRRKLTFYWTLKTIETSILCREDSSTDHSDLKFLIAFAIYRVSPPWTAIIFLSYPPGQNIKRSRNESGWFMRLQPSAFGLLSLACKDPTHNYLHQLHYYLEGIWNFLKYITFKKYWWSQFILLMLPKITFRSVNYATITWLSSWRLHSSSYRKVDCWYKFQIYVMSRDARGDAVLLRILEN